MVKSSFLSSCSHYWECKAKMKHQYDGMAYWWFHEAVAYRVQPVACYEPTETLKSLRQHGYQTFTVILSLLLGFIAMKATYLYPWVCQNQNLALCDLFRRINWQSNIVERFHLASLFNLPFSYARFFRLVLVDSQMHCKVICWSHNDFKQPFNPIFISSM